MDVVNGKIVSAGSSTGAGRSSDEGCSAPTSRFHGLATSLGLEPSAARWNKLPSMKKQRYAGGFYHKSGDMMFRPAPEHRLGWGQSHFAPESETNLDQILVLFESELAGAATMPAGHDSCTTSSSGPENPTGTRLLGELNPTLQGNKSTDFNMAAAVDIISSDLKRKRFETDVSAEVERAWSQRPLKLLLRKTLSMSDVGELGRIIIPKKCAESQFQRILDIEGGTILEMHDYDSSKRWFFRFKWWVNNKSRMYVLENTGEFVKHHGLKERDIFIVYEDNSKKTVVRGHKGTDMDSLDDNLQEKITNSTEAEGPASMTDLP